MAPGKRSAKAAPHKNEGSMPAKKAARVTKKSGSSKGIDPQSTSPSERQALGATGANIPQVTTPAKTTRRTTRSRKAEGSPLLSLEAVVALKPKSRRTATKPKAVPAAIQKYADSLELDLEQEVNADAMDTQDGFQAHSIHDVMDTGTAVSEIGNADTEMEDSSLTQTALAPDHAEVESSVIGYEPTEEVVKHDSEYDAAQSHCVHSSRNSPRGPVVGGPSQPKFMATTPANQHKPAKIAPLPQHKPWFVPAPASHFGSRLEKTTASAVHISLAMGDTIDLHSNTLSLPLCFDSPFNDDSSVHAPSGMPAVGGSQHSIHLPVICRDAKTAALIQRMFKEGKIVLTDDGLLALVNASKRVQPVLDGELRRTRERNAPSPPTSEHECLKPTPEHKLEPLGHDLMKDAGDERWITRPPMSQQEYDEFVDEVLEEEIEKIIARKTNIDPENSSPIEEAEVIRYVEATSTPPAPTSTQQRPNGEPASPGIFSTPGSIARNIVGSFSSVFTTMFLGSPSKTGRTAPEASGISPKVPELPAKEVQAASKASRKRVSKQLNARKEQQRPRKRARNLQRREAIETPPERQVRGPILRKIQVTVQEDFIDPETGEPKLTTCYMTVRGHQELMKVVNKRLPTKKQYLNKPGTYGMPEELLNDSDSDVEPIPTRADVEKFKHYVVEFDSPLGQVGVFNKGSPPISVGLRAGRQSARKHAERAATATANTKKTEIPAQTAVAPADAHTPDNSGKLKRKKLETYPPPENGGYGFRYGTSFVIGVDPTGEALSEDESLDGSPVKKRKVSEHELTPHPKKISSDQFVGINGIAPPKFLTKKIDPGAEPAQTPSMPIVQPATPTPIVSSDLPSVSSGPSVETEHEVAPGATVALDKARKGAEQYKPMTPSGLRRVSVVSSSPSSLSPIPSRQMSGSTSAVASPMAVTIEELDDADKSFDSLFDDPKDHNPSSRKLCNPGQEGLLLAEGLETRTSQPTNVSVLLDVKGSEGMRNEHEAIVSVTSQESDGSDDTFDLDLDINSNSKRFTFPDLPADADPVARFGIVLKPAQPSRSSRSVVLNRRPFALPDITFPGELAE